MNCMLYHSYLLVCASKCWLSRIVHHCRRSLTEAPLCQVDFNVCLLSFFAFRLANSWHWIRLSVMRSSQTVHSCWSAVGWSAWIRFQTWRVLVLLLSPPSSPPKQQQQNQTKKPQQQQQQTATKKETPELCVTEHIDKWTLSSILLMSSDVILTVFKIANFFLSRVKCRMARMEGTDLKKKPFFSSFICVELMLGCWL